jgi:DNA primase
MNLFALMPDLRRAAGTGGGEFGGPCPWCGGEDRFRVWPLHSSGRARYWCRRCERAGDDIDLLRELKGLSFREAAAAVGQAADHIRPEGSQRKRLRDALHPPTPAWQAKAEVVAIAAAAALWQPGGRRALDYLRRRGLADDTIRAARLGYVAKDLYTVPGEWGLPEDHRNVWVPRGVVIPWRACGSTWRVNVRRPVGEPKYCGPAGAASALYGADGLRRGLPVVLVEGEFDALAVAQEVGDLVCTVATGSTHGARHPRWKRLLATAPVVLIAFDEDEAGGSAARHWLDALPRSRRLVPAGDPAGMLESGCDLRNWVQEALR